jgi:hypothetical protein
MLIRHTLTHPPDQESVSSNRKLRTRRDVTTNYSLDIEYIHRSSLEIRLQFRGWVGRVASLHCDFTHALSKPPGAS